MKKNLNSILLTIFICVFLTGTSSTTAFAVPEDYLNEFQDGVNSALDDAETYLDDIWNNVSSAIDNTVNDVQDYINSTEPEEATDIPTDDIYEPEPTEPPTEEVTTIYAPTENEDYDYSYEPPTEPPTEVYEPEILTETYTDAPFIDRFALTDAEEGNLFIALGLWISIAIGIIIVVSVVMTTHRRKKGN
ncbi:MAG: hypothetical protein UHY68_09145 [Acutalibacteraceae bacterium]|nr:hypothetical protein [Acutalibacteraceae bacterium]